LKDQDHQNRTSHKNHVYLGLGSNIEPEKNIIKAADLLHSQFNLTGISDAWESFPVGTTGPKFVNAALSFNTVMTLEKLKKDVLSHIENQMGRVRTSDKNAPRTIDLDILIWNDQVIDSEIVNHPHLSVPVAEIYPGFKPYGGTKTIQEIASELNANMTLVNCPEISKKLNGLLIL
jgi:2-amino-4-hydroxy-6-hydroxymethyldihydropteridine diphosphokinase